METTQKLVGLAGEEGLHSRFSHSRQQNWTQSWKYKWAVDQHLALADCYHVGIWAWRFSIDARNMDFYVKHQDFFSFPSYRLITYVSCFSNYGWWWWWEPEDSAKEWQGLHFATITKTNKSMVVVCYLATKNNRAMLSFMAFV